MSLTTSTLCSALGTWHCHTLPTEALFSDHYLTTRLSELPEWHADHDAAHRELSALLSQRASALPTLNEAQTEQQFIRPALDVLGWSYETQITFRALERDYRPD